MGDYPATWGALIEFQIIKKISLMPKLNSAIAWIQTADPWVIGSKPNALTSDDCLEIDKLKFYNLS